MTTENPLTPGTPDATIQTPTPTTKMVPEADLLALKGSKEGLEKKLGEATATIEATILDTAKQVEVVRQQLLASEAKAEQLEEQIKQSAGSSVELAEAKKQLEEATKNSEGLIAKALDYRRQMVATAYGIPVDTLKEKTLEQLDLYEEALKAVSTAKGIGNYAVGGGGGAGSAAETPMDRAKRILAAADAKMGRKTESENLAP